MGFGCACPDNYSGARVASALPTGYDFSSNYHIISIAEDIMYHKSEIDN